MFNYVYNVFHIFSIFLIFQDLETVTNMEDFKHVYSEGDDSASSEEDPCPNTVVKNPKYRSTESYQLLDSTERENTDYKTISRFKHKDNFHKLKPRYDLIPNSSSSKADSVCNSSRRGQKYCNRELLSKVDSDYQVDSEYQMTSWVKCDYCGGRADITGKDGAVCNTCEKLGLELDQLVGESAISGKQCITVIYISKLALRLNAFNGHCFFHISCSFQNHAVKPDSTIQFYSFTKN